MGMIKDKEISGLCINGEIECLTCLDRRKADWGLVTEDQIITQGDTDPNEENWYFCDNCKKQLYKAKDDWDTVAKKYDFRGANFNGIIKCVDCLGYNSWSDWGEVEEHQFISLKDLEESDERIFCDKCQKQLRKSFRPTKENARSEK